MTFLGIDPGLSGALAVIWENGGANAFDIPVLMTTNAKGKDRRQYDCAGMVALVVQCLAGHEPSEVLACVESQHSFPGQSAMATFSQGLGFGILKGILAALQVPTEFVHPIKWKKAMGLSKDKNQSLLKAKALFPGVDLGKRKDAGRAEALLLAQYAKRSIK